MESTDITEIVTRTGDLVGEHYVFPEVGQRLAGLLAANLAAGRYAGVGDPAELSTLVTKDLQSLNGDLHMRLKYHEQEVPDQPGEAMLIEMLTREAAATMCGIARVALLDGGIAHLDLSPILLPPSIAGDAVSAAMSLVAPAAGLIIDLRGNLGGDPEAVQLVCGYLFDEPVHLLTMYAREGVRPPQQQWSLTYVPGRRFGGTKPVHVLTSRRTFSGGESLAYALQQRGRATVVGERTGGGAHPRTGYRVHPRLEVTVPVGRPSDPDTGTNWEGVGVQPDIEVPAETALDVAHTRLRELVDGVT